MLQNRTDQEPATPYTPEIDKVSVTTLEYDRDVKIPLYAAHAIPEVWLFDVATRSVSIYREPTRNGYRRLLTPSQSDTITALLLAAVHVPLAKLWLE